MSPPVLISSGLLRHPGAAPTSFPAPIQRAESVSDSHLAHRPPISKRYFSARLKAEAAGVAAEVAVPAAGPKPRAAKIASTSSAWPAPISTSTWPPAPRWAAAPDAMMR